MFPDLLGQKRGFLCHRLPGVGVTRVLVVVVVAVVVMVVIVVMAAVVVSVQVVVVSCLTAAVGCYDM